MTDRIHQYRNLIFIIFFIHLVVISYFVLSGGDPKRADTARYLTLAETLCAEQHYLGPNVRNRSDILRITEPQENFLKHENATEQVPEVFRTPGYPVFLCGLNKIGIESHYGIVAIQYAMYLFTVFLIWHNIKKLFAPKVANFLAISLLVIPGGLIYALTLYSEVLFLLLFAPAMLLTMRFTREHNTWLLAVAGALFALSFYVKPSVLYLPFLFAGVLVVFSRQPRRHTAMQAGLLVLVFCVGVAPWLLRNHHAYGTPYVSGQMSNMLAIYHLPTLRHELEGTAKADSRRTIREAVDDAVHAREQETQQYMSAVEIYTLQQRYAISGFMEYPMVYAKLWLHGTYKSIKGDYLHRFYLMMGGRPLQWGQVAGDASAGQFLIRAGIKAEQLFWTLIAGVAALAIVGGLWRRDPVYWISGLCIAFFLVIPGTMGYSRFRFPVDWLILTFAISLLDVWVGKARRRD
ncbi:MAG TPA: hypothetical protein DD979_04650 [Gammaproteobacteria bacterium]|nr:hypothetical protein [Gammaproteobacteria bacterium]